MLVVHALNAIGLADHLGDLNLTAATAGKAGVATSALSGEGERRRG